MIIPGMNRVSQEDWEGVQPLYDKPIQLLVDRGVLEIHVVEKPTVAIVKKTFDLSLLNEWLELAPKGTLKNALTAQIKAMQLEPVKKKTEVEVDV
jgi:hypothetical protein